MFCLRILCRRLPVAGRIRPQAVQCPKGCWPRQRAAASLFAIGLVVVAYFVLYKTISACFMEDKRIVHRIAEANERLRFMEAQFGTLMETMKVRMFQGNAVDPTPPEASHPPEVVKLLNSPAGKEVSPGLLLSNRQSIFVPSSHQLLPHLTLKPNSLRPSFHLKKHHRPLAEIVLGVPTVYRDKESYLIHTLSLLIRGMSEEDLQKSLILVFIGESDLELVLRTAILVQKSFNSELLSGLIEIFAPSEDYYPNFDTLRPTLGDSPKRFKWRTKQNLDALYLMTYAQSKGTYYLMLEDDVASKQDYLTQMKDFTTATTISNPNWVCIEYSTAGGFGKLFRSADLPHFITYLQLFYQNQPIDWLLEGYLADRVCTVETNQKQCTEAKMNIRPRYPSSLFGHIGLYSSLKGKIQKVKDTQFGGVPSYFPHYQNPALESIKISIKEVGMHTAKRAYDGLTFFWGHKPYDGDVIEFWFHKPTVLASYLFRSANYEHSTDKFYAAVVEVKPVQGNFTQIGFFDEFGLAEGTLNANIGPMAAIRLKVVNDSKFWVILSEIDLKQRNTTQISLVSKKKTLT